MQLLHLVFDRAACKGTNPVVWESFVDSDCSVIARNNQEASNNSLFYLKKQKTKQPQKI